MRASWRQRERAYSGASSNRARDSRSWANIITVLPSQMTSTSPSLSKVAPFYRDSRAGRNHVSDAATVFIN